MKPDLCPFIYHDAHDLYLEFETCVLRFAFTEGGLHRALKHIPDIAKYPGYTPLNGKSAKPTRIARKSQRKREILNFSAAQRNAASAIARNLKK